MKTSFAGFALALAANASAFKPTVSGDGFFYLNGKQLIPSDGLIDFQSNGAEFRVGNDGTLSLPNGQQRTLCTVP